MQQHITSLGTVAHQYPVHTLRAGRQTNEAVAVPKHHIVQVYGGRRHKPPHMLYISYNCIDVCG